MSNPVTNSEVEDVLASIRRLVGGTKKKPGSGPPDEGTDRLVLTPQQRVPDSDVPQLQDEHLIDNPEDQKEPQEPALETAVPLDETEVDFDYEMGDEYASAGGDEPLVLQQDQSVAYDAPASDEQVFEPESTPINPPSQSTGAGDEAAMQSPRYSALSQKIAALETAIARTEDQWEPDGEGGDAYAGTTPPAMTWPDSVELDGTGKPVGEEQDTPDRVVVSDEEGQFIDEETLQEMITAIVQNELRNGLVAQAVREELQGDLGARITSNIRKLVRREIHLALTSQGIE